MSGVLGTNLRWFVCMWLLVGTGVSAVQAQQKLLRWKLQPGESLQVSLCKKRKP